MESEIYKLYDTITVKIIICLQRFLSIREKVVLFYVELDFMFMLDFMLYNAANKFRVSRTVSSYACL